MLQQYIMWPIEKLCNQGMKCFPFMDEHLSVLEQKNITFVCDGLIKMKFFLRFENNYLKLMVVDPGTSDLTIKGDIYHLIKLLTSSEKEQQILLTSGKVVITGDVAIAEHLKKMMAHMEIDWEEKLSHLIGDIAAHQVGNVFRGVSQWRKATVTATEQNITEYLQEEIRILPPREEIEDFFDDIDGIRNDIDRLETLWQRLQR